MSTTPYSLGTVTRIESETSETQTVNVSGATAPITRGNEFQPLPRNQFLKVGQKVIVSEVAIEGGSQPVIVDVYRLPVIGLLFTLFSLAVILVARRQGLFSLLGMVLSLAILVLLIIPQILAGQPPLLVSILGATAISAVTLYLSHGWKTSTHIAFFSILASLLVVALLAHGAVLGAYLTGLGSEEAAFLQVGDTATINLRGLLLGGILLGALGVLDDIAVSQVAVVAEIASVKKGKISFAELFRRSFAIGKTHVASLVNTLVLAYAGANLPLFLLFFLNKEQPWWVIINSEILVEEMIRTLTGSIGLIVAVPLTTAVAALWALKGKDIATTLLPSEHSGHHHAH